MLGRSKAGERRNGGSDTDREQRSRSAGGCAEAGARGLRAGIRCGGIGGVSHGAARGRLHVRPAGTDGRRVLSGRAAPEAGAVVQRGIRPGRSGGSARGRRAGMQQRRCQLHGRRRAHDPAHARGVPSADLAAFHGLVGAVAWQSGRVGDARVARQDGGHCRAGEYRQARGSHRRGRVRRADSIP